MNSAKRKDRLAAAFPNLNLVGAGAADELSRSVKLEHIEVGQRDRRPLQLYASRNTESRVKSVVPKLLSSHYFG